MKNSKIGAIISCRCPQCREGQVFKNSPFKLNNVLEIHKTCPSCGFRYEVEPGFFWAALYISYGINVGIIISFFLLINMLTGSREPLHYLIPIILGVVLPLPFTLRYARIILLHFFSGAKYQQFSKE